MTNDRSVKPWVTAAVRGLEQVPLLTHAGIGSECSTRETVRLVGLDGLRAEIAAKHDRFLLDLEQSDVQDEARLVFEWFQSRLHYPKLKHPNRHNSSYGLKHVVERHHGGYVANGTFIAVAIGLGYRCTPVDAGQRWIEPSWVSPLNVYFDISRKALNHRDEAEPTGRVLRGSR
jgi:hypothetical protein